MENHVCYQQEALGSLKEAVNSLKDAVMRLDKRVNGTFDTIGKHIDESPQYRSKIDILETEVKNIRKERNNSVKASQWRIALIVGILSSLGAIIARIIFR